MNPIDGILRAARTMSYFGRLQEVTANNLANVNTPGFKMDRLTARRPTDLTYPIPVESLDLSQGGLRTTGRSLDVALEGTGFLVVETEDGERLSRGGSLRLDGGGRIVADDGVPVLGASGPIVATGSSVEIEADGTVKSDGQVVDRFRLVRVAEGTTLVKEGAGRFRLDVGELLDAGEVIVRQGQLEDPNLDAVGGMIALVGIQRGYGAATTALKTMDGVLGSVTTDLARL